MENSEPEIERSRDELLAELDRLGKWLIVAVYCLGGEVSTTAEQADEILKNTFLRYSDDRGVMRYTLEDAPIQSTRRS